MFFVVLTAGNYDILRGEKGRELVLAPALHAAPAMTLKLGQATRSPSSASFKDTNQQQIKNIDIGCEKKNSRSPQSAKKNRRHSLKNSLLMVTGKSCMHESGYNLLFVKNATNGFTASVFGKPQHGFQTDFIQMNEGLNRVVFELENSKGEKFTEIVYFELKS